MCARACVRVAWHVAQVSEEKQRQIEDLTKESEDKRKLLEELDQHESKHAAALAQVYPWSNLDAMRVQRAPATQGGNGERCKAILV